MSKGLDAKSDTTFDDVISSRVFQFPSLLREATAKFQDSGIETCVLVQQVYFLRQRFQHGNISQYLCEKLYQEWIITSILMIYSEGAFLSIEKLLTPRNLYLEELRSIFSEDGNKRSGTLLLGQRTLAESAESVIDGNKFSLQLSSALHARVLGGLAGRSNSHRMSTEEIKIIPYRGEIDFSAVIQSSAGVLNVGNYGVSLSCERCGPIEAFVLELWLISKSETLRCEERIGRLEFSKEEQCCDLLTSTFQCNVKPSISFAVEIRVVGKIDATIAFVPALIVGPVSFIFSSDAII